MSLADAKVGDEVVLTDVNIKGSWRRKVSKIGRKYATICGNQYELATGRINDAYGHRRAYTLAQWERREATEELRDAIRRLKEVRPDIVPVDEIRDAARSLREIGSKLWCL